MSVFCVLFACKCPFKPYTANIQCRIKTVFFAFLYNAIAAFGGGIGQLELDRSGYIVADESTRASISGVFAVGDVRTKALRQIVTAAADGAHAVTSVEHYLYQ